LASGVDFAAPALLAARHSESIDAMTDKPRQILFVCTGNVCRSPMAEYLFRRRIGESTGWVVGSAGTLAYTGARASLPAIEALAEWDIDLSPHRSRELTPALVAAADLIVVMTEAHRQELGRRFSSAAGRTHRLTAFGAGGPVSDIPDPIGQSLEVYRHTRDRIDSALSDLILHMVEQHQLQVVSAPSPRAIQLAVAADETHSEVARLVLQHLAGRSGLSATRVLISGEGAADRDLPRLLSDGGATRVLYLGCDAAALAARAGRVPGVRAAFGVTPYAAMLARTRRRANLLALTGPDLSREQVVGILDAWLPVDDPRRIGPERRPAWFDDRDERAPAILRGEDPDLHMLLEEETVRQELSLELVASENYASAGVRETMATGLTHKYAEGLPGRRWYPGCRVVDEIERLAIERARALFGADHANVQPHSGSSANRAVLFSVLKPGDVFLAMNPAQGGHLSHGHEANYSGRLFRAVHYGVSRETEQIDYDEVERLARETRPKLICAGASAYARLIDFERFRRIADQAGCPLLVDMAHIAGLVAGGRHPSPVPFADFVTTTTHKTLRGPRGGLILCRKAWAEAIDQQVFPGLQGGPLLHVIAAKAVCFGEALQPEFKEYAGQVVRNAQALAGEFQKHGLRIVSGGTDNHLLVVDLSSRGLTGKQAAEALEAAAINVNKCPLPFDARGPAVTSGIRLGTAAMTTRGMVESDLPRVVEYMEAVLRQPDDASLAEQVKEKVRMLAALFPVP
jgi:glycine hydroxymethyltransferase